MNRHTVLHEPEYPEADLAACNARHDASGFRPAYFASLPPGYDPSLPEEQRTALIWDLLARNRQQKIS